METAGDTESGASFFIAEGNDNIRFAVAVTEMMPFRKGEEVDVLAGTHFVRTTCRYTDVKEMDLHILTSTRIDGKEVSRFKMEALPNVCGQDRESSGKPRGSSSCSQDPCLSDKTSKGSATSKRREMR